MSAIDLTTVANVKAWMIGQITESSTQDAIIQSAITAVSADFIRRCGRGPQNGAVPTQSLFNEAVSFSETYNGNGNERLFLRNSPIISVQSLTVNGNAVAASSGSGFAGYAIDGSGKSLVLLGGGYAFTPQVASFGNLYNTFYGPRFPRGTQNIAVSYMAGYAAQSITNELQAIPASPGPYTVTVDVLPWLAGVSVNYFSSGNPLTQVFTAPTVGQYFIQSPGVYLFSAADAGAQVLLNYNAAGTPPDIELAARKMVYLTYKRRGWVGLRSQAQKDVGQTNYSSWEVDEDVLEVIRNYTRKALVA
jgi:hypothetical protein